MTTETGQPEYTITVEVEGDDEFKRCLQRILTEYHEEAHPLMEVPQSERIAIRVTDDENQVVDRAFLWARWGWLDISLLALDKGVRGQGLGGRLTTLAERKAREEGCPRVLVETLEDGVSFYQGLGYRIARQLEDYPEGYSYYWTHKDLPDAPRT